MNLSTAIDLTIFYATAILLLGYAGYGLTVLCSDALLRRYLCPLSPLVGFCLVAVLSSLLNSTLFSMGQATWLILGVTTLVNLYALYTQRAEALPFSDHKDYSIPSRRTSPAALEERGRTDLFLAAASLLAYALGVLPLVHAGTTAFIGLQWDLELYIPITEYLKRYPVGDAILAPANPLLDSLNAPAFRGGSGWGFSYVEAFIGSVLGWPSFETFRPMLHFTLALSVPSLYLFSKIVLGLGEKSSALAATLWALNGLALWIASIGLAGHTVTFFALPLALTLAWTYLHKGINRGILLASVVTSGLVLSFYTGAMPLLAPALASLFLYRMVAGPRWATAKGSALLATTVLFVPIFGHLRFLEVLPLYFKQGFSSGWHYTEFSSPAELLGISPFVTVIERAALSQLLGDRLSNLAEALVGPVLAASVLLCALAAVKKGWNRGAFLVFAAPYLLFLLYLRYLSPYPYGFFKALSMGYFLVVPLFASGLMILSSGAPLIGKGMSGGLPGLSSQKLRAVLALAFVALFAPLALANLALSIKYFWDADPQELPRSVWELDSMRKAIGHGSRVYVTSKEGYDQRVAGIVSYFLMDNPLVGRIETAYGKLVSERPGEQYNYLLLRPGDGPLERGMTEKERVWENELVALYRAPEEWLATVELEATGRPLRLGPQGELSLELAENKWSLHSDSLQLDGALPTGEKTQQVEFSLLSLGEGPITVLAGGQSRTITPAAGLFTYRTEPLKAPAELTVQSGIPDASVWVLSIRIMQPRGEGSAIVQGDKFLALSMAPQVDGPGPLVSIEYAAKDSRGGDLVLAAEVYSAPDNMGIRGPVGYSEVTRIKGAGSSKAYMTQEMFRRHIDGGSSAPEGRYEGHLAVYYVNEELARWPVVTFNKSKDGIYRKIRSIDQPFVLSYLPSLKDVGVLKGLIPAGSELFLSTLTHPDRSFIRVAAGALDSFHLYADPPLADGVSVAKARPGRIYEYALLDVDEEPAEYGYSQRELLWKNEESALYRRGKESPKALFRFGDEQDLRTIQAGESITIDVGDGGAQISSSNGRAYRWQGGLTDGWAQAEISLATESQGKVTLTEAGKKSVFDLPPGVFRYRTHSVSPPYSLEIATESNTALLTLKIGDRETSGLELLPDTVAVAAVSRLEGGGEAVVDMVYYGPKDTDSSIGVDIYGTEGIKQEHYGWWAIPASRAAKEMTFRLDLLSQKGELLLHGRPSPTLPSQSWRVKDGPYRGFIQLKRNERFQTISAFDFVLKNGSIYSFKPLKVAHVVMVE